MKNPKTRWIVLTCVLLIAAFFACTGAYGEEDDAPNTSYEGRWVPICDDYKIYLPNDWIKCEDHPESYILYKNDIGFVTISKWSANSFSDVYEDIIEIDQKSGVDFSYKYSERMAYGNNILLTFYRNSDTLKSSQAYLYDKDHFHYYKIIISTPEGIENERLANEMLSTVSPINVDETFPETVADATKADNEENAAPDTSYAGRWVLINADYKIYIPNDWVEDEDNGDDAFYYVATHDIGIITMIQRITTPGKDVYERIESDQELKDKGTYKYSNRTAYRKNILISSSYQADPLKFVEAELYDEDHLCEYKIMVGTLEGAENDLLVEEILSTISPIDADTPVYVQLQKGSEGTGVVLLQERLNALGYSVGTADGSYGSKSAVAISEFQQNNGLKATGIADEKTQEVLYSDAAIGK